MRLATVLMVFLSYRSGTLGLYQAMKILGYNSYHIYECVAVRGVTHVRLFHEAVVAQFNRLAGLKRYTRADFDKWLCDYDVSSMWPLQCETRAT